MKETIGDALQKSELQIILIYHGRISALTDILDEFTEERIPVVLAAHEQRLIEGGETGSIRLYSPGERGNNIGRIHISENGLVDGYELYEFYLKEDATDPVIKRISEEYSRSR